jgi:hypothetical protein
LAARMHAAPARPDTTRAELGDRAATALAEEHFEPDLAIRERAHQAEARAWPDPLLTPGDVGGCSQPGSRPGAVRQASAGGTGEGRPL